MNRQTAGLALALALLLVRPGLAAPPAGTKVLPYATFQDRLRGGWKGHSRNRSSAVARAVRAQPRMIAVPVPCRSISASTSAPVVCSPIGLGLPVPW